MIIIRIINNSKEIVRDKFNTQRMIIRDTFNNSKDVYK